MNQPKVVKSWDELPPVLNDGIEVFETRVLEYKYRQMMRTLKYIASQDDDIGNWAVGEARDVLRAINERWS